MLGKHLREKATDDIRAGFPHEEEWHVRRGTLRTQKTHMHSQAGSG